MQYVTRTAVELQGTPSTFSDVELRYSGVPKLGFRTEFIDYVKSCAFAGVVMCGF